MVATIEGMKDYKRLEDMLKNSDQKREKDLARVEGKLDAVLEEIKALIIGTTIHHNEIRS